MARRSKQKRRRGKAAPTQSLSEPELHEEAEEGSGEPNPAGADTSAPAARTLYWASWGLVVVAMLVAWGVGVWLRGEWVREAEKFPDYQWNGGHLLTTHDSFFYASVINQGTAEQPDQLLQHPDIYHQGLLTLLGAVLVKAGFDLPTLTTWMPAVFGALIVVPVILIGRLYGSTLWGFCAALLAVAASSYYSRTTPGYFDTDMFAVTWPTMALYLLLRAHREESRAWLLTGALALMFYPFAYSSGASVVIAMGLSFIGYRLLLLILKQLQQNNFLPWGPEADDIFTWDAILLIAIAGLFCLWTPGSQLVQAPWKTLLGLGFLGGACWAMGQRNQAGHEPEMFNRAIRGGAVFFVLLMLYFGGPWHVVKQSLGYLPGLKAKMEQWQGAADASPVINTNGPPLQFQEVKATIVEVKKTPFFSNPDHPNETNVALRVSGSDWGFGIALAGLVLLVLLYPEFLVGAPLLGIGLVMAHIAGHRFTIHAVPLMALAATFLPLGALELARRIAPRAPGCRPGLPGSLPWPEFQIKFPGWAIACLVAATLTLPLTGLLLKPNYDYDMALARGRPPVLRAGEVMQLDELKKISKPGDYVLTWWDYGSAVWLYAGRNVLTTPYNQSHDNYIIAKILNTDSQALGANLARFAVEVHHQDGPPRGGALAVEQIFRSPNQSPNEILEVLKNPGFRVPKRTRDVFLYLPEQMMRIFPVLHQFSERDLATGEPAPSPPTIFKFTAWQHNPPQLLIGQVQPGGKPVQATAVVDLDAHMFIQKTPIRPPLTAKKIDNLNLPSLTLELRSQRVIHCNRQTLTFRGPAWDLAFEDLAGQSHLIKQTEILAGFPSLKLRTIEMTEDHAGKPGRVTVQRFDTRGRPHIQSARHHLVCSRQTGTAYLLDEASYHSNFIQMYLLGRFDPQFFEPVISGTQGRIYRVKR